MEGDGRVGWRCGRWVGWGGGGREVGGNTLSHGKGQNRLERFVDPIRCRCLPLVGWACRQFLDIAWLRMPQATCQKRLPECKFIILPLWSLMVTGIAIATATGTAVTLLIEIITTT